MLRYALICFLIAAGLQGAEKASWLTSLEAGKTEAFNKRKPLVLVRYLDKHEKSGLIFANMESDDYVSGLMKKFVCVKLNDTSAKDNFAEYPVLQVFSPEGKEYLFKRLTGSANAGKIGNSLGHADYMVNTFSGAKFDPLILPGSLTAEKGKPMRLRYSVPERGYCIVRVYDRSGAVIKKLFSGVEKADKYTAEWDLKDRAGKEVPSGKYVIIFDLASYHDIVEVSLP